MVLGRLEDADLTWNYVNAAIWSAAEPAMGVIAACIPSLRPLFAFFWQGSNNVSAMSSKRAQANTSSTSSNMMRLTLGSQDRVDRVGRFERLEEGPVGQRGYSTDIHGGQRVQLADGEEDISMEEANVPYGAIKVENEVVITTQAWEYKDKLF